jgi:hypothetical protein
MFSDTGLPPANPERLRVRWLVIIVGVMALLTVGWPLLSLAITNRSPIAPLTTLTVGPGRGDAARFTVGPGWSMLPSDTNPRMYYTLRRGGLDMSVTYVSMANGAEAHHLWTGLDNVIRVDHPGIILGKPSPITTAQGREGMTSTLTGAGHSGTATVLALPSRDFAVELVMVGPSHVSPANLMATMVVIRSVVFPAISH